MVRRLRTHSSVNIYYSYLEEKSEKSLAFRIVKVNLILNGSLDMSLENSVVEHVLQNKIVGTSQSYALQGNFKAKLPNSRYISLAKPLLNSYTCNFLSD